MPVLLALAAILGHTFPIYLRFRGGKGVATSLGGVLALDPISCAIAVVAFAAVFVVTRYVSLSALLAGVAFVAAHFWRDPSPWNRNQIAMSLFSIAVLDPPVRPASREPRSNLGRHRTPCLVRARSRRKSLSRAARSRSSSWSRIAAIALVAAAGAAFYRQATQQLETTAGPWMLREIDRTTTGQQRVDRVVFAEGGKRLAAICPRYDRLVIYDVKSDAKLAILREVELEGRPVALAADRDRFVVLERPHGDERHVEPGWWETFDLDGNRKGPRHLAGFYPDDLALSLDGRHLYVISSGQAEGDPKKPMPAMETFEVDLASGAGPHREPRRLRPQGRPSAARSLGVGTMRRSAAGQNESDRRLRPFNPRCPSLGRKDEALECRDSICFAVGRFRLDHDARGLTVRSDRHRIAAESLRLERAATRPDPPP